MSARLFAMVLLGCSLLVPSPARAADFFGEFGGWEVYRDDDACSAVMEFEGPGSTTFVLVSHADGSSGAVITNDGWTAEEKKEYQVSFEVNGTSYSGKAFGTKLVMQRGFLAKFSDELSPKFVSDFAQGSTLYVYLGDSQIDQLSLAGTAVAVGAVQRCLTQVRTMIAADQREKARWAHLPKDPFAAAREEERTAPNKPAIPLAMSSWANRVASYYPAQAQREGRQGSVELSITVSADGRAAGCAIASSSGHADLDEAACSSAMRYARFQPATDGAGKPTTGVYATTINYSLN